MPNTQDFAFIQLFWELLNRKTGELGKVDFQPQKPAFDSLSETEQPFPRSTPEEQGLSSAMLCSMMQDLIRNPHVGLHQITVVRHGHIVYEAGVDPYIQGVWHATYSMCKSFVGMAIGILADEGKLTIQDHVLDILKNHSSLIGLLTKFRYRNLTVRDLLVMSSGTSFNEVGAITGNDWVKSFFDSAVKFEPGTKFEYNSMNTLILSAIVQEITGKNCFAFLKERLFEPMGIRRIFWESSPKGITKGGWGMFITQEDAAKLGQLYLNKGEWNGRQLISQSWVEESTRPQISTGRDDNPWYGYQLWISNLPGSYMYNGMLGQDVMVYPSLDMIIVTNAGNDEVFAGGIMTSIIRSYINEDFHPSDTPLPEDPAALRMLNLCAQEASGNQIQFPIIRHGGWGRSMSPFDSELHFLSQLNGRVYEMHTKGIGLFPLIMQVMHNNYTRGIRYMRFILHGSTPYLEFQEGSQDLLLPVGFGKSRHVTIEMNGEPYIVGTLARIGVNEDGEHVITMRFAFIEEACSRTLKIIFHSMEDLELIWCEVPGNSIIAGTLEMITTGSGNTNPIIANIMKQISPELMQDTLRSGITPIVKAQYIGTRATDSPLTLELQKAQQESAGNDE